MKFAIRFTTTGKVPIPGALCKELEKAYLHSIVRKIEENDIPLSLVLNLDQTPWKYIPVSNMAARGSKTVPIKGLTNKLMITATFTINLDGHFLSMQLIYAGKTKICLGRVKFPSSFSLRFGSGRCRSEGRSIGVLGAISSFRVWRRGLGGYNGSRDIWDQLWFSSGFRVECRTAGRV